MSGTNAVSLLADNIENATGTSWPLTIGVIGCLLALGVFFKVGKRAGFRT